MKKLFTVALLLLAAASNSLADEYFNDETGDIDSHSDGRGYYRIYAKKDYKVVIEITELDLRYGSYITVQDGKNGEVKKYTKTGSNIWMYDGDRYTHVDLPIRFETIETRKLIIYQRAEYGLGFTAHYTSYTEEGTCRKDDVDTSQDDPIIVAWDTDRLSPVASRYDVIRRCGANYQQYNTTSVCEGGHWVGSTECHARTELLDQCVYDFDELTISDDCPYSVDEAINYYLEVEQVDLSESEGLGRSIGRGESCRPYCARDRKRRYRKRNCRGSGRGPFLRCLMCRIKFRCAREDLL